MKNKNNSAPPKKSEPGTRAGNAGVYPVFERFHSWQGEGAHAGRSAFFIRLFGCPIRCVWCDSAGTWGEVPPASLENLSAETLAAEATAACPDFVVVTGGEPAIRDLSPLCAALRSRGLRVHLETSGAFPIRGDFDWIALSPKTARLPLEENWARASELKIIVSRPEDIAFWSEKIARERVAPDAPIWLHPEWSQRENSVVLDAISSQVRARGFPFRAGWQLHKLYAVR